MTVTAFVLLLSVEKISAQVSVQTYTVKDGRMFIALSEKIDSASLDNFISKYNLGDLGLRTLIRKNNGDTLRQAGWNILLSDHIYIISKPLSDAGSVNNSADNILFTSKNPSLAGMFPATNNGIRYGSNRFKNKYSFEANDSLVTFFLRNNLKARGVMLAGSFNDWKPDALPMIRTDSGWIAKIKLGAGKYWYKFIADKNWMLDDDNQLSENDGLGNINSVFYKTNFVFTLNGFTNAKKVYVAGSFNDWQENKLAMTRTATGWQLPVYLAAGTHTYRFIADGKWFTDPDNRERLPNEFGDFNSVIRLGKTYRFKLDGYTNAQHVVLAGTFNNWREEELLMNKTATGWELNYALGPGNYEYKFMVDGNRITDPGNPLQVNGDRNALNSYLIIDPNYTFHLKGYPNAAKVFLAGDFNNWSPESLSMTRVGDEWIFKVHLFAGKHIYKFNVNGKWIRDPQNNTWEENEFGTGNSVIWIDR